MSGKPTTRKDFAEVLANLRDVPSANVGDKNLNALWEFIATAAKDGDGVMHWFCPRADTVVREAAVFMLRLYAFNSPKVQQWKEKLSTLLGQCPGCVSALQQAKLSSRNT
jgi:senataxin